VQTAKIIKEQHMVQESEYFIMIMCLAPVLAFFASAGLLTILKKK
jgi:hypothetical protein